MNKKSGKKSFNRYIGLVLFYSASVFLLLEASLRIYYAVTDKIPPHFDYSVRKEWQWVRERATSGNASFNEKFDYDPWIGWNNRANLYTEEVKINAEHMRNKQEFSAGPHPRQKRLVILGDSFSFGYGVSNEQTYAAQLADNYLQDWEVLNLSVSATGTDQQIINYRRYGKKYEPDIVVLGFYLLDYSRNLIRFRYYAKPMFELDEGRLVLTNSPVPAPEELYQKYVSGERKIGGWGYSYAIAAFAEPIINHEKRDRSKGSAGRKLLAALMLRFRDDIVAQGAVPIWLILPDRDIVEKGRSKYEEIGAFSQDVAKELGMAVINMDGPFRAFAEESPDQPIWRPKDIGGHLSSTGHSLVAKGLHRYMDENGLLQKSD